LPTLQQSSAEKHSLICFCQLRDVEAELEAEQRRGRDTQAENRKLSRQLQELRAQSEDDRRALNELADQVNTLQQRIKTLRRQLEEAVSDGKEMLFLKSGPAPPRT